MGAADLREAAADPAELRFLLTGTARSGTTLVQRLACELPAVWIPQETHFWGWASESAGEWEWPVRGDHRHAIAETVVGIPTEGPLPAEPLAVARQMMLRHRRIGLWTVFESLVAALSPPDRPVLGEKTPNHMFWWEQIRAAVPGVKMVAVVRHPVDVFASHLRVPWGERDPYAFAERWIAHQRAAWDAVRLRGPEDVLLLRYEDVVARPGPSREKIAALLGVASGPVSLPEELVEAYPLFAGHESWKAPALGKVKSRRPSRRRRAVPRADREVIDKACGGLMEEFGYEPGRAGSGPPPPPEGEALDKVLAFREWHAAVGSAMLPVY